VESFCFPFYRDGPVRSRRKLFRAKGKLPRMIYYALPRETWQTLLAEQTNMEKPLRNAFPGHQEEENRERGFAPF
jgi:hypothetical protein